MLLQHQGINTVCKSLLFFFVLSLSFTPTANSQATDTDPTEEVITLFVGENITLPLKRGVDPFVSNEDIISILHYTPGHSVAIEARRGGVAQLFFWRHGVVQFLTIHVEIPESLSRTTIGPQFMTDKIYFNYIFSNSFSFSNRGFYENPNYFHQLFTRAPLFSGRFINSISFHHISFDTLEWLDALASYIDRYREFSIGNINRTLSQVTGGLLTNPSIFGAQATFYNFLFSKQSSYHGERFTIFAGVNRPDDLFQLKDEGQQAGLNYFYQQIIEDRLTPNIFNTGLILYQPLESSAYHFASFVESNYYLTPHIAMGGAFYVSNGRIAVEANPSFEDDGGTLLALYQYIQNGFGDITGTRSVNDQHHGQLDIQRWLDAKQYWILDADASYLSLIQTPSSPTPSSTRWIASLGLTHLTSFRSNQNIGYTYGRSAQQGAVAQTHTLRGGLNYPVSNHFFMGHSLQYAYTKALEDVNTLNAFTFFATESTHISHRTVLSLLWENRSRQNTFGFEADTSVDFAFYRGDILLALRYQKENFNDKEHQFDFESRIDYILTSVIHLNLNSSLMLQLGQQTFWHGFVTAGFQIYFGPGVKGGEPLFASIFGGLSSRDITGRVFLDQNFNGIFDEGDLAISDANLRLNQDRVVKTNDAGIFRVKNTPKGLNLVHVDTESFLLDYEVEGPEKQTVRVTDTQRDAYQMLFPFSRKMATVQVKCVMDNNNNHLEDGGDVFLPLDKITLTDSKGETRTASASSGATIFRGVPLGHTTVEVEGKYIPIDVEFPPDLVQALNITDKTYYDITYFFRPIRSVQGKISLSEQQQVPPGLIIQIGTRASQVDKDGNYWIKHLQPGTYAIQIHNLKKNACISKNQYLKVEVPIGPFIEDRDIRIQQPCHPSSQ